MNRVLVHDRDGGLKQGGGGKVTEADQGDVGPTYLLQLGDEAHGALRVRGEDGRRQALGAEERAHHEVHVVAAVAPAEDNERVVELDAGWLPGLDPGAGGVYVPV